MAIPLVEQDHRLLEGLPRHLLNLSGTTELCQRRSPDYASVTYLGAAAWAWCTPRTGRAASRWR
jgi:hypothetical protein